MTHLSDAQLRTHLDGELDETGLAHLRSCPACRARLDAVAARAARVAASMASLAPAPGELPAPAAALSRLNQRQRKDRSSMIGVFTKRFRPAFITAALVLALGFALTFPPVQALAANFLGLFRIQQVQVIEIDTSRIGELTNDASLGERMGETFSNSFRVTREASAPQVVDSARAAADLAGFAVRLPGSAASAPTLTVQSGTAFEFTIDRPKAQAILNDAGFDELQLPASLDGATISVDVPASVSAAFGDCPRPDASEAERDSLSWTRLRTCVIFTQMPSPTVNAPADLDVQALAEIGLQFIGLTPEEAKHLSETVDWTTTLVIPIPRNAAEVRDVSVDGVTGTLVTREYDDGWPPRYTLIWVKDSVVYAISGFDSPDGALAMANSLK